MSRKGIAISANEGLSNPAKGSGDGYDVLHYIVPNDMVEREHLHFLSQQRF